MRFATSFNTAAGTVPVVDIDEVIATMMPVSWTTLVADRFKGGVEEVEDPPAWG